MALVFTFLALLINPIMSAPIMGTRHPTDHPLHAGLEKRSPLFMGHHSIVPVVAKRSVPCHDHLVAHGDQCRLLEPRTTDDLGESVRAKRADGQNTVRLVRRKSKIAQKLANWAGGVQKKFQNFKKSVETGVKKAVQWVRDKGAQVAKFATKIVATAADVIGHVAKIPVFKAITNGVSRVANFVSDHIHAKLLPKLQKGVDVMNHIQHPFDTVKGKAGKALGTLYKILGKRDFVKYGLRKDSF